MRLSPDGLKCYVAAFPSRYFMHMWNISVQNTNRNCRIWKKKQTNLEIPLANKFWLTSGEHLAHMTHLLFPWSSYLDKNIAKTSWHERTITISPMKIGCVTRTGYKNVMWCAPAQKDLSIVLTLWMTFTVNKHIHC